MNQLTVKVTDVNGKSFELLIELEHRPVGLSTSTEDIQNKTMHRSGRLAALDLVTFLAATR
jgi:hypothetical protein